MANRRFIDFPVATTVGANDIILIWQDGLNKQTTKATILSGLPEDLEDLADVNISGLTNGQILRYDSTTGNWVNSDQGDLNLNDLNDVSIVSPANGQVLVYNSSTSKWENSSAGLVPYVGAVTTVDLGAQGLRAGYVRFNTSVVSVPDEQGIMFWDADDETVDIILNGYTMKIGEDLFYPVKNQTGSTIAKGTAVRFNGTVGASGRLLIAPFIANGSVPSSRFMGVTAEEILNGEDGKVLYFGRIRGINTNAFNEGDILYASTTVAGGFQTAIPVAPNNIVQVAAVVTKSINQGTIFVRPTLGSSINKDEGVKITSVADKDLLQYQSGTALWENKTLAQVIGSAYVPSTRTLTINGTTQDLSADRTFNVGTVTSVGLSSATSGVTIGSTPVTTSGTITLAIATASGSQNGLLSSTDWNTFNSKQNALTNPVTGTGTTNYLPKFTGSTTIGNSQVFDNGTNVGINTATPLSKLNILVDGAGAEDGLTVSVGSQGDGIKIVQRYLSNRVVATLGQSNYTGASDSGALRIYDVGGTETIRFSGKNGVASFITSGNLLVGATTDNGARLQVSGTATITGSTNQQLVLDYTTASGGFTWQSFRLNGTNRYRIFGNTDNSFTLYSDILSANVLSITSGGNVGIGTTGGINVVSGWTNFVVNGSTTGLIGVKANEVDYGAMYASTGGNNFVIQAYGSSNAGNMLFLTASTERMRITSSGNVGIGTSSPGYRLHVRNSDVNEGTIAIGHDNFPGLIYSSASTGEFRIDNRSSAAAGYITFFPNGQQNTLGNEAMRIANSRNVLIGTTTDNGARLNVNGSVRSLDVNAFILNRAGNPTDTKNWYIQNLDTSGQLRIRAVNDAITDGINAIVISRTGISSVSIAITGAATFSSLGTGTVYSNGGTLTNTNPSDFNLKENIAPINYGLGEILQLNPVTFNWKNDTINQGKQYGFIAQEVQKIMPDLVKKGEYLGLDKEAIFTTLVKAIQELKQEIDTLKN